MEPMIFKPAARYPADPRAVFILALSVFSGLTAFILKVAPDSLEALLPQWGVAIWGATLALGSATTLIGMAQQSVTGIIIEQIGSVMVGAATVFYSTLIFWFIGPQAIQTVGIIMAWGIACFIRWFQLQTLINDAAKRGEKRAMLEKIEAEIMARQQREEEARQARREWWHH